MKITSENFNKEVMESEIPVLIDFWAEWCTPCKMMSKVVEELEKINPLEMTPIDAINKLFELKGMLKK